jgi:hypothetical protein
MSTITELANEARGWFERATRNNGETFWKWKEGAPEWISEMCHKAHGDMMPDDWRYTFIIEALDAISNADGDEDEALTSLEPDIYTGKLTAWLASNVERASYCDEYISDTGTSEIFAAIAGGQLTEMYETFSEVYRFLRDRADCERDGEE